MSSSIANYSPERVTIVLALMHTVTGYASGSFVSIEKTSPTFSVRESSDGVVSRTLNPSKLYVVRLTLAQSSDSNSVLSWMHNADRITKGRAKFPLTIKDSSGSSVMFSAEAWITRIPVAGFSDGVETREWEITCAVATNFIGGNYDNTDVLDDFLSIGGGLLGGVL
jgi:hypothetical protein